MSVARTWSTGDCTAGGAMQQAEHLLNTRRDEIRPAGNRGLDTQADTCLWSSQERQVAACVSMDEVFHAISDPTRRAILDELADRDGQSLFEICSRLTMKHGISSSRQAISQHLEVLE